MNGYVISKSDRTRWIFKRDFKRGEKVSLQTLYELYATPKPKYQGDFDEDFLEWLESRLRDDFEIIIED